MMRRIITLLLILLGVNYAPAMAQGDSLAVVDYSAVRDSIAQVQGFISLLQRDFQRDSLRREAVYAQQYQNMLAYLEQPVSQMSEQALLAFEQLSWRESDSLAMKTLNEVRILKKWGHLVDEYRTLVAQPYNEAKKNDWHKRFQSLLTQKITQIAPTRLTRYKQELTAVDRELSEYQTQYESMRNLLRIKEESCQKKINVYIEKNLHPMLIAGLTNECIIPNYQANGIQQLESSMYPYIQDVVAQLNAKLEVLAADSTASADGLKDLMDFIK